MGREGRILSEIWADESFQALSVRAQRLYFLLISQPDIEKNGVIPLRERRWAKGARDSTTETIWTDLLELRDAQFIVMDEDAGELLIRSYIRRDEVYRQPFPMVAAGRALRAVTSTAILETIATEIDRVVRENADEPRQKNQLEPLTDGQKAGISQFLQDFRAIAPLIYETITAPAWEKTGIPQFKRQTSRKGSTKGSRKGSTKGMAKAAGDRGKGIGLLTDRRSQALKLLPNTAAPTLGDTDDGTLPGLGTPPAPPQPPRKTRGAAKSTDHQFDQFWEAYPKRVGKIKARAAWAKAIKAGVPPESIIAAATQYAIDQKDKDYEFKAYPATWLNAGRWDDERPPRPATNPHDHWNN